MSKNSDSTTASMPSTASQGKANSPLKLAILISGGGRTMENIQHEILAGRLNAQINLVISSSTKAQGIERAENLGLKCDVVARRNFASPRAFSEAIWPRIREAQADLVCLAGFLSLLTIPADMTNRVLNIHPALLPAFGGPGMFGHHVHEAVLAAGCKVSGCTVHVADNTYDTGPILVQRSCPAHDWDTPDTLAARVFEEECHAYPEAIRLIEQRRACFEGRIARIKPA